MVFLKPVEDLKFSDIERLKTDEICESQILDYKEQLLEDNKLLKQVSAFANTQGGFLIFGVKETRKGGYPKEIRGIDKSEINKERMEQIVLGNIHPRLNLKIHLVNHRDQTKAIVVVRIPNSYLKPHMNLRDNKFYKRYQFQASPMTEIEVNDAYRRRFAGYQEVEDYISGLLEPEKFIMPQIIGQIIVIPTVLRRIIETSNREEFAWIGKLSFKPKEYPNIFKRCTPKPSPNGVKCQRTNESGTLLRGVEIHRNGCIHYFSYFGQKNEPEAKMLFNYYAFCVELLHMLQFATTFYQRYNYFGDVKIMCDLRWVKDTWLPRLARARARIFDRIYEEGPCQDNIINIVREFPTIVIESEYGYIASGIMDEIFNHYGVWKCSLFDDEGNLRQDILK